MSESKMQKKMCKSIRCKGILKKRFVMDKKTQTMVILGLVAVGGYMWWKSKKSDSNSAFSNASGGKRWCYCNGIYLGGICHITNCQRKSVRKQTKDERS